jgi:hypothetical protein
MLKPLIVLSVITIALLRGGSLHHIAALRLRWLPLVFGSLALQLLIFTPFRDVSLITAATPWIYILSMLLLVAWITMNRHIPGMLLMAAGLLFNLVALIANGGAMPVTPEAVQMAGVHIDFGDNGRYNNSILLLTSQTNLWLLTDIIPVPFAGVFSIGDVLLTLGVAIACYRTIRPALVLTPAST